MSEVCKKCQGQKTYRGIGCIIVKCKECNGAGTVYMPDEVKVILKDSDGKAAENKALKKSKKRIIDEQVSKSAEIEQNLTTV